MAERESTPALDLVFRSFQPYRPVLRQALVERFNNVPLVDANCAGKVKVNPVAHTRACELQCQKSGLGIVTEDGNFLKFDAKGNTEAVQLLSKSTKADHLRVNVTGKVADGTLAVQSISMK